MTSSENLNTIATATGTPTPTSAMMEFRRKSIESGEENDPARMLLPLASCVLRPSGAPRCGAVRACSPTVYTPFLDSMFAIFAEYGIELEPYPVADELRHTMGAGTLHLATAPRHQSR